MELSKGSIELTTIVYNVSLWTSMDDSLCLEDQTAHSACGLNTHVHHQKLARASESIENPLQIHYIARKELRTNL